LHTRCRGYKSTIFLRVYIVFCSLAVVIQLIIAVLFLVPSTRNAILDLAQLSATARSIVNEHSTAVAAVLLCVLLLQLSSISFVLARCRRLDEHYDSDTEEAGLLSAYSRSSLRKPLDHPTAGNSAATLGGIYEDDSEVVREKATYAKIYDKYSTR
jgi:hypothetical protein